jgi:hypothetical protein
MKRPPAWTHVFHLGPDVSPVERLVLLALLKFADFDDGRDAFPSIRTIAQVCGGLSERAVQRALRRLESPALGLVVRRAAGGGRGRAATYDIAVERLRRVLPFAQKGDPESPYANGKGDPGSPFTGGKGDSESPFRAERVTGAAGKGDSQSPDLSQVPIPEDHQSQDHRAARGDGLSTEEMIAAQDRAHESLVQMYREERERERRRRARYWIERREAAGR